MSSSGVAERFRLTAIRAEADARSSSEEEAVSSSGDVGGVEVSSSETDMGSSSSLLPEDEEPELEEELLLEEEEEFDVWSSSKTVSVSMPPTTSITLLLHCGQLALEHAHSVDMAGTRFSASYWEAS